MENAFAYHTRVYLEDVDQGGIVYHANYLKYAERARTELLRERGIKHADIMATGAGIVVKDLSIRYLRPLALEEDLVVLTKIGNIAAASATLVQHILREGTLMATIDVAMVFLNAQGKPTRWPDAVKQALGFYASNERG